MKYLFSIIVCFIAFYQFSFSQEHRKEVFPDGTPIPDWFYNNQKVKLEDLGNKFMITDYGAVNDSTLLQTKAIQHTIDVAASRGGGVVIIPKGVFLSGALFFKPKTHLFVSEGAVLKGSDNISDYPKLPSRMEGQNLDYFSALVNAYGVDGFTISGKGTINGNGAKYWQAFWQRRKENPQCTNLEVSRPRLVFIRNSNDVQLQDVKLVNSGFWTSHYYKCNRVKLIGLYIFAPHVNVKAPSSDAVDIDVCSDFHIKDCYFSVNDDAIALKGGKGPWADKDTCNGPNTNVLIEDCNFGFCHSALTNGSESIHNRNILMRNCQVNNAQRLLWLKMRPDTPQDYEFVTVENVKGQAKVCLNVYIWKQFFDMKGRKDMPVSSCSHITLKNIDLKCDRFFAVDQSPNIQLSGFLFENLNIEANNGTIDKSRVKDLELKNVYINHKLIK